MTIKEVVGLYNYDNIGGYLYSDSNTDLAIKLSQRFSDDAKRTDNSDGFGECLCRHKDSILFLTESSGVKITPDRTRYPFWIVDESIISELGFKEENVLNLDPLIMGNLRRRGEKTIVVSVGEQYNQVLEMIDRRKKSIF